MISYVFCTVAIGEKYFNKFCEFMEGVNRVSNSHHFIVVTDQEQKVIENCSFHRPPDELTLFYPNGCFNYNLKYYPIKLASQTNFGVVIYIDADWMVGPEYTEEKINKFVEFFFNGDYDFLFERPHGIVGKHDWDTCFWRHKIEPYKLMETDYYDEGHVCNEQFLVFKNNDKLKIFVDEWDKRDKFSVSENIWPFAEGLEIGMSSIDAKMKFGWLGFPFLNSCFMFYCVTCEDPLIRF